MNDFSKDRNNLDNIDVVILCGGLGTRLRSIISDKPKVLAKIGDTTFLDILINNISSYGFKNIILCVGYLKEYIKRHFGCRNNNNYNIIFSEEEEPLGTGGALKNAEHLIISSDFIIMNGDSICKIDLNDLVKFHDQKNSLISIVLSKKFFGDDLQYGFVDIDEQQRIMNFIEKPIDGNVTLINAGIYLMKKDIFSYMPTQKTFSLEHDLFPKLSDYKCYGFITESKVIDIGTPERYKNAIHLIGGIKR